MQLIVAGGAYSAPSIDINNQRCVNMYPISGGDRGRSAACLIPAAGLESIVELSGGGVRKLFIARDDIYAICGPNFYKLNFNPRLITASPTLIGTIDSTTSAVSMAANPTQIMIVDGTATGYIYNMDTEVFVAITDVDFQACTNVVFLDGYFIVNRILIDGGTGEITKTGQHYCSALNNGLSWDPLDVGTAESDPDPIIAIGTAKGEVWFLGDNSTEIWYNAANETGTPISPRKGLTIKVGCSAPSSLVSIDDRLMWLDNRGYVVVSGPAAYVRDNNTGYQLDVVSTDALTAEFWTYGRLDNAVACQYNDRGNIIYQITFPSAKKTWAFNLTNGLWHERSYYDVNLNSDDQHLIQQAAQIKNRTITAGLRDGKIYLLDSGVYTDDGAVIKRIRTTSPQSQDFKLVGIDKLELRLQTGKVPVTGDGSDPYIQLRYSHNGGYTWSDPVTRSMGGVGNYAKKIQWNRLGTATEWVFEFAVTEPIEFVIIDCTIDIEEVEQ